MTARDDKINQTVEQLVQKQREKESLLRQLVEKSSKIREETAFLTIIAEWLEQEIKEASEENILKYLQDKLEQYTKKVTVNKTHIQNVQDTLERLGVKPGCKKHGPRQNYRKLAR